MKKFILGVSSFLCLLNLTFAANDNWIITKSTHFIVYYKSTSADFIDVCITKAENYYSQIAENLGFNRYDFWLWDNRAKIYIYDTPEDYQKATNQPAWSSGAAVTKEKIIYSYPQAKHFFNSVLPHELGHIIFREFVGFDNAAVPLWLDEGVACYQEKARLAVANRILNNARKEGKFINLPDLANFDVRTTQDAAMAEIYYAEALSVVEFLVRQYSRDTFMDFCKELKEKQNFKQALNHNYNFKNIHELDSAWQDYLGND